MIRNYSIRRLSIIIMLIIITSVLLWYWVSIFNSISVINIDSNYITYENIDKLDQSADLILIGTPITDFSNREHKTTYYHSGDIQDFYTLSEIKIDKIIKQSYDSDLEESQTITIIEPVSLIQTLEGKIKLVDNNYQELNKGSKYVIFLKENTFGTYSIINNDLGKFNIDSTDPKDEFFEQEKKAMFKKDVFEKYKDTLQDLGIQ